MKMWKKTLAMLMCATMAVGPMAGCFDKGDDSSSSDSTPTPPAPPAPTAEELATEAAETYVNNAITALEGAKSCKIVIDMKTKDVTDYFGEDGKTIDPTLQETDTEDAVIEIVITEEGEGVAIKMINTRSYCYDGETVYTDVSETIVTNGKQYARSYGYDSDMTADEIAEEKTAKWINAIEMETEEAELPVELIEKLLGAKEVEDAYNMLITELQGSLKDKILAEEAADGNFVWEYDYAADVNGMLAFIEAIDETKDTLGKVINDVLAEVAPGLTAEALLGQLKAYSKMTLANALTNIDTMLTSQYGVTLQVLKDAIVNSEIVGILMSDEAAMDMTAEEIAEVKAWKFDSLKTGEYGEAVVGDLINNLLLQNGIVEAPAEGEEPVDYVANFFTTAEESLDATLEELGITMPDCAGNVAKKLEGTYGVSFDTTTMAIEEIGFSFDAELVSYEEDYNEETDEYDIIVGYYTQYIDLDITVSEISSSTVTVTAPAAEDVITCVSLSGWRSADENLYNVSANQYGVRATFKVCDESGEMLYWVEFSTDDAMENYGETLTVTVENAAGWGNIPQTAVSAYYDNNTVTLTFTLNADGTYAVSGIPTLLEMQEWYYAQE